MNYELLVEHFHRLGDAPEAVPRLRRFILDLAVRGKLVEQDPHEESADELVKRIQRDTKSRVASGQFREPKSAIDFPWNELPFGVPEHWKWARLIEFAEVSYGFAFDSNKFNNMRKGMPLIRIRDISKTDTEAYTEEAFDRFYIVKQGDLLIGMDGDFNARKWKGKDALLNQRVCRVRDWQHGISSDFIMLPLQMILDHLHGSTSLTTVKHLSAKQMNGVYMPLPPLPEQHRIVAKVEELMALCDRLEAAQQQREAERTRLTAAAWQAVVQAEAPADVSFALEQLPALTTRPTQVKALRQTILDLAVRGRLVEQEEGDEPAELLLGRIRKEKERLVREGVIRKPKLLQPVMQADLPTEHTPKGWVWTRLGAVSTLITKGSTPTSYGHAYTTEGVSFIKVEAISNGRLVPENVTSFISEATNEFLSRSRLAAGDVLFSIAGSIGTCAIVSEDVLPANTNQALAIIRGTQTVFATQFLLKILQSSVALDVINKARGVAMNNISLDDIQNFIVPVPPLAEQRRIVAKVEELMALCDGLEAALEVGEALRGQVLEAVVRSETGGTEPPAPVRMRQLPVPKVRAPRYEEAEAELAVAAEPVGHTGALQAVVRRGPGRPLKNEALTSTAARSIETFLHAHPGWHGKAVLLEATGVDAGAWNAAIKELLEAGKVERQGVKKGARYRGK